MSEFRDVLKKALREVANRELGAYRTTVFNWKTPVEFYIVEEGDDDSVSFGITTDSLIWRYVNYGTKPHTITANGSHGGNGKVLSWGKGWQAKTTVGKISSGKGKPKDHGKGSVVVPQSVEHTGATARRFDELISKKADERLEKALDKEMSKYLKRLLK